MYQKRPEKIFLNGNNLQESQPSNSNNEIINPFAEREVFVKDLIELLKESSLQEKINILSLVFFHSVEDGMKLAKKIGLPNTEIFSSLIQSCGDKDEIAQELMRQMEKDKVHLNSSERRTFETEAHDFEKRSKLNERREKPKIPAQLNKKIREYYAPFITQKRVQERASLKIKPSDNALLSLFEKNKSIREKRYFFSKIASYLKEKTGKEIIWSGEIFLTEAEVEVLFKKHKLSFEEAIENKVIKSKKEYAEMYYIIKTQAQAELKKEIIESLEKRGYNKENYEIVKMDEKFVIEFKEGVEKKEMGSDYQKEKIDAFKKELMNQGVNKDSIARGLAGVSTPEAMKLREELMNQGVDKDFIAWGLAGVSTPEAMKLREELIRQGVDKDYIALGLAGVSTPEAMKLREELMNQGVDKDYIALGLAGVSTPEAMKLREELMNQVVNKDFIAWGLAGVSTPEAMKLREELIRQGVNKDYIAWGLAGVSTPEAMKLREELMNQGVNKDYIAWGLAGVSTPEAMKLREELMNQGVNKDYIAWGLAGVSTPEAMKLREELMNQGVDKDSIALGLAGVSTPEAMKLREELIRQGVNKDYIAEGLAGVSTPEAMAMRKKLTGRQEISLRQTYYANSFIIEVIISKNTISSVEKKTGEIFPPEYTELVLTKMRELMNQGVNKDYIARGLAGVSTPEAMKLREELMNQVVNKGSIALGLAGVSTPEAMKLREELIRQGVDKDYIALGLAGVSTPEAMKLREELIRQGVDKDYIAWGLAGVSTPEAMKLREELMNQGVDKGSIARGLAGVSTPEAMKLREELIRQGVNKDYIAEGLAGVSTPEAMKLREELMNQGVTKDSIARGLAGVSTPEAMKLREELIRQGVDEGLIYQYSFCNGSSSLFMTKIFEEDDSNEELIEFEKERLEKLTLTEHPDLDKEAEFLKQYEINMSEQLSQSSKFASQINKLISESPALFFEDIRAKGERVKPWQVTNLVYRLFPSIKEAKNKERKNREGSFLGSIFGRGGSDGFENSKNGPNNSDAFFANRESFDLFGGDPSAEGVNESVIEFRNPVNGMLCSNIAMVSNRENSRWEKIEIPLSSELVGPVEEITGEIPKIGLKEITLPRFTDAKIIPERIKLLNKNGKEVEFDFEVNQMGQYTIRPKGEFSKIIYSQEKQVVPSVPDNIDVFQYQKFKEDFEKKYGYNGTERIVDLSSELKAFVHSIKHLSPVEQVAEIEEMTRKISVYDMNNKEVMPLKEGKGNDERLSIMQMRMDEMTEKENVGSGKMYAGVCADFAMLSTAMLREAGFVSGVISGLKVSGTKADSLNAHAVSFALWPRNDEKYDMYTIDGTPDGRSIDEQGVIEAMREKSLKERIKEAEEKADLVAEEAEKQLAEIEKIIEGNDLEKIKNLSNGHLENILNNILKYKVKRHHLQIVESVLNAGRYSGVNMDNTVSTIRFIEGEIKREKDKNPEMKGTDKAGKEFFDTISDFIRRYKDEGNTTEEAIKEIEKVLKISEKYLSSIEAKAAFATINYLKAKNLV